MSFNWYSNWLSMVLVMLFVCNSLCMLFVKSCRGLSGMGYSDVPVGLF